MDELTGSPTSSSSYDVTGLTNGTTYYFAVTSLDTTGNESAKSGPVSATPVAPPATVSHCGAIAANETWTSTSIHRLTCSVTVNTGVTLKIEAARSLRRTPAL